MNIKENKGDPKRSLKTTKTFYIDFYYKKALEVTITRNQMNPYIEKDYKKTLKT